MENKINEIKQTYNINEVFPLAPIILERKKVYLFYSKQQEVAYSLYTDGNVEHLDTWCDRKPSDRDSFLEGCLVGSAYWINRFEFQITDANILLIEKKYKDKIIRNLYIDQDNIDKLVNKNLYQISINSKEKLMIKKIGEK